MADQVRAARLLAAIAFKADPWRAVAVTVISVANAALMALTALWLKMLVEGVIDGDQSKITWAAAAFGVTGLVTGVGAWLSFDLRTVLTEKTGMALDQRMVSAAARVPGLEHYERPEYLDRLSILRQEREHLARTVASLVQTLTIVVQAMVTAVLLASVSPLLLALPLFGIPSLMAGAAANNVRQRALEETATDERLARHVFQLATTSGPGKELRVFGLGPEIVARFDAAWARLDRVRTRAGYRAAAIGAAGWLCF